MGEIKKIPNYIYETTDGRDDFATEAEAIAWQNVLDTYKSIIKLDSKFEPTDENDEAWFVRIDTDEQVEAFNAICRYNGFSGRIKGLGHYYYDSNTDDFISIHEEMQWLQKILFALNTQFTVQVPSDTDEVKRVDSL